MSNPDDLEWFVLLMTHKDYNGHYVGEMDSMFGDSERSEYVSVPSALAAKIFNNKTVEHYYGEFEIRREQTVKQIPPMISAIECLAEL